MIIWSGDENNPDLTPDDFRLRVYALLYSVIISVLLAPFVWELIRPLF